MEIKEVKLFWQENPLWTGESNFETGSFEFFEEHREIYLKDCFAGNFDLRFLPPPRISGQEMRVLDLGCGIGFWTVELAMRGIRNIVAADLTQIALEITRLRCEKFDVRADFKEENAEALSFSDDTFDHVNCQGVIHHTPDTQKAISEIARVLKPGGTASISVYYRNFVLRSWPYLRWVGKLLYLLGSRMKGRGRDNIFIQSDVNEIVRMYDGVNNPIGKSYTENEFVDLLSPFFDVNEIYFHFFPARALFIKLPKKFHRILDQKLPFMIYANVKKTSQR